MISGFIVSALVTPYRRRIDRSGVQAYFSSPTDVSQASAVWSVVFYSVGAWGEWEVRFLLGLLIAPLLWGLIAALPQIEFQSGWGSKPEPPKTPSPEI